MSSSLDQCPDCKQEISLSAEICPYCGCQEPFAKDSVRENSTEEQDSLSTEEMPESTDETAPFSQGNQATTQEPSDESTANSGSSYKKWVWPCLVSALVIGAISVALVWWVNSQRYVLSDSNAHTEILLKIHSADDPEHPGKKLKVSDEAALQLIVILKRRLEAFGCKHKVKKVSNEIISVKLPALRSSELDSIKNDLTYFGKFDFRLSHPNSNALISENAQRARGAERMSYEQYDNYGEKYVFTHFIERKVALSGSHIKSASVQRNPQTGVPEIHFTLDAIGKSRIAKITEKHGVDKSDPRLLTIVLNGKLIAATTIQGTAPNIQGHEKSVRGDRLIELILQEDNFPNPLHVSFYSTNSVTPLNPLLHSAHAFPPRIARIRVARVVKIPTLKWIHSLAQITGDFTFDEARAIANLLKNQFENPVQIIEVKQLK